MLSNHSVITIGYLLLRKRGKVHCPQCKSHSEENKFYCGDCKKFICSICVVDDHQGHKAMSVFKYGEILKNELKKDLPPLESIKPYYDGKEKECERDIENLEKKKSELLQEVNQIDTKLQQSKTELEKIAQKRKESEISVIVLSKSIDEMGVTQLMNKDFTDLIKEKIKILSHDPIKEKIKILSHDSMKWVTTSNLSVSGYRVTKKDTNGWDSWGLFPLQKSCKITVTIHSINPDRSGMIFGITERDKINTKCGNSGGIGFGMSGINYGMTSLKVNSTDPFHLSLKNDEVEISGGVTAKGSIRGADLFFFVKLYFVGDSIEVSY